MGAQKVLRLTSGGLEVTVDPTGAAIRQIAIGGKPLLYDAEGFGDRLVEPSHEASRKEWLRGWRGGWDEIVPNPGSARVLNGRRFGFHGSVSRRTWTVASSQGGSLNMSCVEEGRFSVLRTVRLGLGGKSVSVQSEITAHGAMRYGWCQHIVFLLEDDQTVSVGDDRVDAQIRTNPASPGGNQSFWSITAPELASIARRDGETIRLTWSRDTWPFLWIWTGIDRGRRFIGLEPRNRPLTEPSAPDPCLPPGSTVTGTVTIEFGE